MPLDAHIEDIYTFFGKERKTILSGFSLSLKEGESIAILGESGGGKSMAGLALLRLLPFNVFASGLSFILDGEDIASLKRNEFNRLLGRKFLYLPQDAFGHLNKAKTIGAQFKDVLKRQGFKGDDIKKERDVRLLSAGFANPREIASRYPNELSGGQNQKILLAMQKSPKAKLVIADEISNGVDEATFKEFASSFFSAFASSYKIVITHDIALAKMCDKAIVIAGNQIIESGDRSILNGKAQSEYLKEYLSAIPSNSDARP